MALETGVPAAQIRAALEAVAAELPMPSTGTLSAPSYDALLEDTFLFDEENATEQTTLGGAPVGTDAAIPTILPEAVSSSQTTTQEEQRWH